MGCEGFRVRGFEGCKVFRVRGFEDCKVLGIECHLLSLYPLRPFHLETSPGLGSADFGAVVALVEATVSYFRKVP